jgi:hypothetical protein
MKFSPLTVELLEFILISSCNFFELSIAAGCFILSDYIQVKDLVKKLNKVEIKLFENYTKKKLYVFLHLMLIIS